MVGGRWQVAGGRWQVVGGSGSGAGSSSSSSSSRRRRCRQAAHGAMAELPTGLHLQHHES